MSTENSGSKLGFGATAQPPQKGFESAFGKSTTNTGFTSAFSGAPQPKQGSGSAFAQATSTKPSAFSSAFGKTTTETKQPSPFDVAAANKEKSAGFTSAFGSVKKEPVAAATTESAAKPTSPPSPFGAPKPAAANPFTSTSSASPFGAASSKGEAAETKPVAETKSVFGSANPPKSAFGEKSAFAGGTAAPVETKSLAFGSSPFGQQQKKTETADAVQKEAPKPFSSGSFPSAKESTTSPSPFGTKAPEPAKPLFSSTSTTPSPFGAPKPATTPTPFQFGQAKKAEEKNAEIAVNPTPSTGVTPSAGTGNAKLVSSKNLKDFLSITGLKEDTAKACLDRFGTYGTALASFVQSVKNLPAEAFSDPNAYRTNAATINKQLIDIYSSAREIKRRKNCSDKEAWASYVEPTVAEPKPVTTNPPIQQAQAPISAFGFGTQKKETTAPATAPTTFAFGFAKAAAPEPAPPAAATQSAPKHVPKYIQPQHFTGPYLDMPDFWQKEVVGRAPLFNLDKGFLERNKDTIRARIKKWLKPAEFYASSPIKYVEIDNPDEQYARVVIKDSERTWFDEVHRKKFSVFLYSMYHEFDSYGQSMSYLAAICLLALTEQETASILRLAVKNYIPGHWAAEAVGFATSAWAVEHLMKEFFPDVAQHFQKLNFWPDTYLQKIMSGLCVHVLNFEHLFEFLDNFIAGGIKYLFQFALAMVEHFRSSLLRVSSTEKIQDLYEIMRLDPRVVDQKDVRAILDRAPKFDLGDWGTQLGPLRSKMYDDKVLPRLSKVPKQEAFEPCSMCEKAQPKWWSDDHGIVCDACKNQCMARGAKASEFSAY